MCPNNVLEVFILFKCCYWLIKKNIFTVFAYLHNISIFLNGFGRNRLYVMTRGILSNFFRVSFSVIRSILLSRLIISRCLLINDEWYFCFRKLLFISKLYNQILWMSGFHLNLWRIDQVPNWSFVLYRWKIYHRCFWNMLTIFLLLMNRCNFAQNCLLIYLCKMLHKQFPLHNLWFVESVLDWI